MAATADGLTATYSVALKVVDAVFVEESLEQKRDYLVRHGADVAVDGAS